MVLLSIALLGAAHPGQHSHSTGGALTLEQAAFDVSHYDIALRVDPKAKAISGTTKMTAKVVIPTAVIYLDLDENYLVSRVTDGRVPLRFIREKAGLRIFLPTSKQPNETLVTEITYSGTPHPAKNAPWDGGFVWAKTASGADWVSVALQGAGADLLFPCKDHPSDRPDSADMRLSVPGDLTAVGPGKLVKKKFESDGFASYHWRMDLPINNYSLVFNAAPYELVTDSVRSIGGQKVPIHFYVLPESKDNAAKLIAEQKKYFHFMEKFCGPFPFRKIKAGIVETPHLGMEHSTAIAYGNKFRLDSDGYDWLLLHEFGHEWWANLVSNADWRDMWIHEGFQSFMDSFYVEQIRGKPAYIEAMKRRRRVIRNTTPVAPEKESGGQTTGGDIYDKGALILHSLRYLIGDEAFLRSIRRMAYPTPEMEKWADGRAMRLVTSADFVTIASRESGQDLNWFFTPYLRHAALPELKSTVSNGVMSLHWQTPAGLPFPMPIDAVVDGQRRRIEMRRGRASIPFNGTQPVIDPEGWVLRSNYRSLLD
jgi:aminopeptidase N